MKGSFHATHRKIHSLIAVRGAGKARDLRDAVKPPKETPVPTIAPEITFHDVDRSQWVEDYIVQRVDKLERFATGITRCHVTLAQENASHKKANRYSVMVEVRIPPQHDLAVKKQKEIRDMRTQLPAAINLAFGAIERQLKRTAALCRGEGKAHGA